MIPSDVRQLMSQQQGDTSRSDVGLAQSALAQLGVKRDSEFWEFYSEYCVSAVMSSVSTEELMDPSDPGPQLADVTEFARETYELEEGFVCITSGEGEGFYLYSLAEASVYDVGVDELDDLEAGRIKPRWASFYDFMRWYVS